MDGEYEDPPSDPEALADYVQEQVRAAFRSKAYDWECAALVAASPGVIVEEPVLAQLRGSTQPSVQEIRCHVVWGLTMVIEYTFDKVGSYIFRRNFQGDSPRDETNNWVFDGLNQEHAQLCGATYCYDPLSWHIH